MQDAAGLSLESCIISRTAKFLGQRQASIMQSGQHAARARMGAKAHATTIDWALALGVPDRTDADVFRVGGTEGGPPAGLPASASIRRGNTPGQDTWKSGGWGRNQALKK